MGKTAVIRARVEPSMKVDVENIFHELGLNASEAVNLFYTAVKRENGIPFPLKIPNKKTVEALKESRSGKNVTRYNSADEMFSDLSI